MKIEALQIAQLAREALLSKKGEDVIILDVRKLSSVTDYYVLATGRNAPQIRALLDVAEEVLRKKGVRHYRRAGTPESEWMVSDYTDVVIHVFSTETRKYYELERLWSDARVVE